MLTTFSRLVLPALVTFALCASEARAHPHVWVTVRSEIVFAPDGSATAVRHRWTFDEMFSVFATQGMDAKKPGGLTREDLAPLAEVNVTSLKDFEFFTFAKADGKESKFLPPKDYWLDHKDGILTLNFTLPFAKPIKTKKLDLEIYDASFFVDFGLIKDGPATLSGAPAACKVAAQGWRDTGAEAPQVSESFFQGLGSGSNFGQQFVNRISVTCP
jgi:ABC-type uncharacterized transport system substrate-binding protein